MEFGERVMSVYLEGLIKLGNRTEKMEILCRGWRFSTARPSTSGGGEGGSMGGPRALDSTEKPVLRDGVIRICP